MAKNWTAYEAAKEIYGNNKENIAEIGSRFPLFTRTVSMANDDYLLDILKALPKITARVVETGLKEMETEEPFMEIPQEEEAPKKDTKKTAKKQETEEDEDDWSDDEEESTYESMTGKDLYALCCKRGISSMCKSRKKDDLIELLEKLDNGEIEPSKGKGKAKEEPKKATAKKPAKKEEPVEEEEDWGEEDEEENPYVGKTAMELFKMCKERGLKVKPKQKAETYVEMLKADDTKEEETEEDEDDDDEWEI